MQKSLNKFKEIKLHVYAIAAILAVVFSLTLLDLNKTYTAQTVLIVLPKSEMAAIELEKITDNVAAFPRMLSFYQRMLADNPNLKDEYAYKNDAARKVLWNESINVKTTKFTRGSLVSLQIEAKKQEDAKKLALKVNQTLFAVTSRYYNFEKDLDLKIADDVIVKAKVSNWGWLVLVGILLGFFVAVTIENALVALEKMIVRQWGIRNAAKNMQLRFKSLQESIFKPQLPEIEKIEDIYKENEQELEMKKQIDADFEQIHSTKEAQLYPNFPEMPVHEIKKSSAPENLPFLTPENVPNNLPIADEIPAYLFEVKEEPKKSEELPLEKVEKREEPTAQELKKRLNQLLRGEL